MMIGRELRDILRQGVNIWNKWRSENDDFDEEVDLSFQDLSNYDLNGVDFSKANLSFVNFVGADLNWADFYRATLNGTVFGMNDLGNTINLEHTRHDGPSILGIDVIQRSKGKLPDEFLLGCGLSDLEIEFSKLFNPELSNEKIVEIQYKIYDLRATRAIQISSLFISYSHADSAFVEIIETHLNQKGVRFWRDIHDMKSGRIEKQIDRAMRLNPCVLLILSEHSFRSDWVEHEVRTARTLEKELKKDVLCPIALDDSWKNSPWAKRIMEQIMEYNILDFSKWKDDTKFENTFNKLIDGLGLFYK